MLQHFKRIVGKEKEENMKILYKMSSNELEEVYTKLETENKAILIELEDKLERETITPKEELEYYKIKNRLLFLENNYLLSELKQSEDRKEKLLAIQEEMINLSEQITEKNLELAQYYETKLKTDILGTFSKPKKFTKKS